MENKKIECGARLGFTVLPNDEIARLHPVMRKQLDSILAKMRGVRAEIGRPVDPEFLIIDVNASFVQEVIDVMKKHNAF
jgi:hypothetical protein